MMIPLWLHHKIDKNHIATLWTSLPQSVYFLLAKFSQKSTHTLGPSLLLTKILRKNYISYPKFCPGILLRGKKAAGGSSK
jgi:hypothetical protein